MKNYLSKTQTALLSSVAVFALSGQAQSSLTLKEVVVTANRVEQAQAEVLADVSIIGREQIERLGANSVPQLLARLPGVQTIGSADASRVFLRGADSRMTALYVDGVRVDSQDGVNLLGGGVPWELVPVSQIERIEVLRGPASAVYGSDAMGGVIQIFTRRGELGFVPYINLGLGSLNTKRSSTGLTGAQSGWDYALGLGYEDSGGYNTRPDLAHKPEREAYTGKTASLRLGYQVTAAQRLELASLGSQVESHYVPWGGGSDYTAEGNLMTSALKWRAQWTPAYSTSVTLANSQIAKKDDVPFDYRTTLRGILIENNLHVAGAILSAVLEQKQDAFEAQPSGYFDPAFSGERTQNAVALGYSASYAQHSVQLNLRNDHDSVFGSHQTGAATYAYALTEKWRATLSTGTAFRAPTLEQIYGPYGSTELSPETNQSTEMGVDYAGSVRSFKAVAYHNSINNMISSSASLATCAAGFFCYYNVGQASIRGVTLSGKQHFNNYDMDASLDWLDPRDASSGRVLSLRARRVLSLGLNRRLAGWQLGAQVQALGQRFDDAANSRVLPGYALFNLNANTSLRKSWKLVVRIDNLTDVQYQQVAGYATPGRTFYAGLQWQGLR